MTLLQANGLVLISSIFLTVLSLALKAKATDAFYLFHDWRLGLQALWAMFVVVPMLVLILALTFDLKPAVKIAILAIAFSPVPPLLPKKQIKAGGSACYVTGLLVFASIVSVLIAPVGLALAGKTFGLDVYVSGVEVAKKVAITIAVPLGLGLLLQRVFPGLGGRPSDIIDKIATILLFGSGLTLLALLAPAMWSLVGDGTIIALVAMAILSFAVGHWVGGRSSRNGAVLGLASGCRHPGVAIAIVGSAFPDAKLTSAAVVLFFVVSTVISVPIMKRLATNRNDDDYDT